MKNNIVIAAAMLTSSLLFAQQRHLYTSSAFSIFSDKVVQKQYIANVVSANEIRSTYTAESAELLFKFGINGNDNEFEAGKDHRAWLIAGVGNAVREGNTLVLPSIAFGLTRYTPTPPSNAVGANLAPNTMVRFQADMRHVLQAIREKGYFVCYNGEKITTIENLAVFGAKSPLGWVFGNRAAYEPYSLTDTDKDGIYTADVLFNPIPADGRKWQLSSNISRYPAFSSDIPLLNALYNLSLDELNQLQKDSVWETGAKWTGVWTRDVSYSVLLGLAISDPQRAMACLRRKVKNGRIIQDTGTGGAYPVSSDRVIWAAAAWEIYKNTHNRQWLWELYEVVTNTISDDRHNLLASSGLLRGESSFEDWREQSYPKWMQPADIYQSECIGTNVAHLLAYRVAAEAAGELAKFSPEKNTRFLEAQKQYASQGDSLTAAINRHLWLPKKGYYGQFRYGRTQMELSEKSDALGEALALLANVSPTTPQAQRIITSTPLETYGIPTFYPHLSAMPAYHNNSVWPFVQALWNWGVAKNSHNSSAAQSAILEHGIASMLRAGALFLTNKENLRADNGNMSGTEVNSDRQLWSVAGMLSTVYRVFFGIEMTADALIFRPCVPKAYAGTMYLKNLQYAGNTFDITLEGWGNGIKTFEIDGKAADPMRVSFADRGKKYAVRIILNSDFPTGKIRIRSNETEDSFMPEPAAPATLSRERIAIDMPLNIALSKTENTDISLPIEIKKAGEYFLAFRYQNPNGPINTDNKCAIRTVLLDKEIAGVVVFPQRGAGNMEDGYSNVLKIRISEAGTHTIHVVFSPENENMNGEINAATLRGLRIFD